MVANASESVDTSGGMLRMGILGYAKKYLDLGLSVIPLKFKAKEPLVSWKEYQARPPTKAEIEKWFSREANIGIVCGVVSGNLLVVDFDSEEAYQRFYEKLDREYPHLRDKLLSTWVVETGKGIHVYFRVEAGPEEFARLFRTKVRWAEGVDVKAEGGYVVAPPSIHPSGKAYEFRLGGPSQSIETLALREARELLGILRPVEEKPKPVERPTKEKTLTDSDILVIAELLREAYRPGYRNFIVLYLTGWLRKARVSYESARKLVEILAENDEEKDHRLYVLDRTYGLKGTPPSPEELKAKSGLQEVLEEVIGEEKALEVIREIEEKLGVASPYYDSVIEILDYEKQLYAVANLRKLVVVRARRTEEGLRYKERVCIGAPTRLTIYINPLGGLTKYEVVWETATRPRPLKIGPAPIEDIIGRLKAEGLVVANRLVNDVIPALFNGYQRKGRAEVKEELEAPGFYLVEGKIISVRWEPRDVTPQELREALELLNELADHWFDYAKDRFATAIKWWIVGPFNYIYKATRRWFPWLYLYGYKDTGKSTLNLLGCYIWGLPPIEKPGSTIDTEARLGHILSSGTFPTPIREPGALFQKEPLIEMLKSAVEGTTARGKYVRGVYTEIPALSPLPMSSNKTLPRDPALSEKRLIILSFTYAERRTKEQIEEFREKVEPRLHKLAALGYWVGKTILENPKLVLELKWKDLADTLLRRAYREAGLEPPSWVEMWAKREDIIVEDMREALRVFLAKRVNEEYARFVGKVIVETGGSIEARTRADIEYEDRVRIVLENRLIPWAIPKNDMIVITTGIMQEIQHIVGDIGGLKSVAELLGWDYKPVYVEKKTIKAAITKLEEFIRFLKGETPF